MSFADNRDIELRDLIGRGAVGVEIALAVEDGAAVDLRIDRIAKTHRLDDRLLVHDRQRTGQCQAGRTGVAVLMGSKAGGAAAEEFGSGVKLDVHFQPDDGLKHRQYPSNESLPDKVSDCPQIFYPENTNNPLKNHLQEDTIRNTQLCCIP